MTNKEAERALAIIDRLRTDGHINNKEQGALRRAILLPERPRDKNMIEAIAVIKEYCSKTDDCNICPMHDNCYSDRLTAVYPLDWYVPEV